MAKYIKVINLWAGNVEERIRTGELVLQCGQWVHCGNDGQLSRFVSATKYCINVCHGDNNKQVIKRFFERVSFKRLAAIRGL